MIWGVTIESDADRDRLTGQLDRVRTLMLDGRWRTLAEIARLVNGSEAGVSARLRDLRKSHFGGHAVERRRVEGAGGLHEYRVVAASHRARVGSSRPCDSHGVSQNHVVQGALFEPPSHLPERVR